MSNFEFSTRARREDIEVGHMVVQSMLDELKDHVNDPSGPELPGADGQVWTTVAGVPQWVTPSVPVWQSYTPSWTSASNPQPALSNGTKVGRYFQFGKLVFAQAFIIFGSTTTAGTGIWNVSLPVTAAGAGTGLSIGTQGYCWDISASAIYEASWRTDGYPVIFAHGLTYDNQDIVAPTNPMTWANTDQLSLGILYEAA